MAEKRNTNKNPFEGKIPEDARQHFRAAHEEFHKSIEGMLPPGFAEHHRKARREILMAMRSIIDASLDHMEKKP